MRTLKADGYRCKCKTKLYIVLLKILQDHCRPNGAVVTRLTRNEKIIGSIPILGTSSSFGMYITFWMSSKYYLTELIKLYTLRGHMSFGVYNIHTSYAS